MKIFRWLAVVGLLSVSPAGAWYKGSAVSPPVATPQTVFNMFSPAGASLAFTNLAHGIAFGASTTGWASTLTAAGYPTSSSPSSQGNSLPFIPNYYGHYKAWWSGTGSFGIFLPTIVYNGGTSTNINGNGFSNNVSFGYNGATTQPTSASPIEFAFGGFVSAVSDAGTGACSTAGGTSGLVCITSTNAGLFGNSPTTGLVQVNFINNLTTQVWTYTKLDNGHVQLQGSTYSSLMSINTGIPGVESEVIMQVGSATWQFPAGGTGNYSSMAGMVICRSQNVGAGGLSDCANILAGNTGQYANPDYAAAMKTLGNRFLRFMDYSQVGGAQGNTSTSYSQRPTVGNLSWTINPTQAYLGATFTNVGDAYTISNPSASPATGAYVDGEIVIGQVPASNTTYAPTLRINRTGAVAAPIITQTGMQKSLVISGPVPLSGSTVSLVFSGGGLGPSGHTLNYTVQSGDTTIGALCSSLGSTNGAVNSDATLAAAGIIAINYDAGFLPSTQPGTAACGGTFPGFTFVYNPNINTSGVAALGSGMTLSVSDNSGQGTVYNTGPATPGYMSAGAYQSYTWSAQLGGWVGNYPPNAWGMNDGPPLEFYEDMVLQAGTGMWLNTAQLWNQNYITQAVTNMANSGVQELSIEFCNEVWNNAQYCNPLATHLGAAVGLASDPQNAWYGLRVALISQTARAAWGAAGRNQSQLHIVNAYQFVFQQFNSRWNGAILNPGSNVTLAAYGNWGQTTLSTNLSASPNRPIDLADLASGAPYWVGAQLNAANGGLNGGVLSNYNGLLLAAYNYAYGTPTLQAAALNFMFNASTGRGDMYDGFDAYAGSVSVLANCSFTVGFWALGSGQGCAGYYNIGGIVASYDAGRASAGLPVLGIASYEEDNQTGPVAANQVPPVVSSLNGLGYTNGYSSSISGAANGGTCASSCPTGASDTSTVAGTNIFNLLSAFKNDARFLALSLKVYADTAAAYKSGGNRIALPASYGMDGSTSIWAKYQGDTIYSPTFKSFNAICDFNGGSC